MDGRTEAEIVSRPADCATSIAESMLLPKTLPLDGRWPVISINASDALKPIELKLEVSGDSVDNHTRGNDDTSTKAEGILAHSDVKVSFVSMFMQIKFIYLFLIIVMEAVIGHHLFLIRV